MGVSYRKMRELLFDKKIQMQTMAKETHLSPTTLAKINKDEYLSMETLEVICKYLNANLGDIAEFR